MTGSPPPPPSAPLPEDLDPPLARLFFSRPQMKLTIAVNILLKLVSCWVSRVTGEKSRMTAIVFVTQMYFVLQAGLARERVLSRAARTRLQVENLLAHYILAFVIPFTFSFVS